MNVCEYTFFPPLSTAPVDRLWQTIADCFAGDFPLASMFKKCFQGSVHFGYSNGVTWVAAAISADFQYCNMNI